MTENERYYTTKIYLDKLANGMNPLTGEDLPEGESFDLLLVTTDYRPDLYDNFRPSAEVVGQIAQGLEDAIPTIGLLSADFRTVNATAIVLVRADRDGITQVIYNLLLQFHHIEECVFKSLKPKGSILILKFFTLSL